MLPPNPVFLKQYGANRTGTNVLRTLLHENFKNVVVLMHVLGNKHSPPVDFEQLTAETDGSAQPAWEFVSRATWKQPARGTDPASEEQQAYMRELAEPLSEAYRADRLGYVISVRDPYSWAYSITAYRAWYRRRYRTTFAWLFQWWFRPGLERRLRDACRTLNHTTAAWLDLQHRYPARTSVVRIEDLWTDARGALDALARLHGLEWAATEPKLAAGQISAAVWDNQTSKEGTRSFQERREQTRREMSHMADLFHRIISEETDWTLMGKLGYHRRAGPRQVARPRTVSALR